MQEHLALAVSLKVSPSQVQPSSLSKARTEADATASTTTFMHFYTTPAGTPCFLTVEHASSANVFRSETLKQHAK